MVILDNSERFKKNLKKYTKLLKSIKVDFIGFGPINGYKWCTSIFFKKKFYEK